MPSTATVFDDAPPSLKFRSPLLDQLGLSGQSTRKRTLSSDVAKKETRFADDRNRSYSNSSNSSIPEDDELLDSSVLCLAGERARDRARSRMSTTCSLATIFEKVNEDTASEASDLEDDEEEENVDAESCPSMTSLIVSVRRLLANADRQASKEYIRKAKESKVPGWDPGKLFKSLVKWAAANDDDRNVAWILRRMSEHNLPPTTGIFNELLDNGLDTQAVRQLMSQYTIDPDVGTFCRILRASCKAKGGDLEGKEFMSICYQEVEDMLSNNNIVAAKEFLSVLETDFPDFNVEKFFKMAIEKGASDGNEAVAEWAARRMSEHFEPMTTADFNAIMAIGSEGGNTVMVDTLKGLMPKFKCTPDAHTLLRILEACSKSGIKGDGDDEFTRLCVNEVEHMIVENRLEAAEQFLQAFGSENPDCVEPLCQDLLQAGVIDGDATGVRFMIEKMNVFGVKLASNVLSGIFDSAGKKCTAEMVTCLKDLLGCCQDPGPSLFCRIIKAHASSKGENSVAVFNSLCKEEIQELLASGQRKEAKELVQALVSEFPEFDLEKSLLKVLRWCCRQGDETNCFWTARRIASSQIKLSTAEFNSLLVAGSSSSMRIAKVLIPLGPALSVETDADTFVRLRQCCNGPSDMKTADKLMQGLAVGGEGPKAAVFAAVIESFARANDSDGARTWAKRSYDALVASTGLSGDQEAAERWIQGMSPRNELWRDVVAALRNACNDRRDFVFVRQCQDFAHSLSRRSGLSRYR